MAQIEFKNLEPLEYFKPLIKKIENKDQIFRNKLKRVLVLQKSGLCSVPVQMEEEF